MSLIHKPKLLSTDEYPDDLLRSIKRAKQRIAITATTFRADDKRSKAIVDALVAAADRGVDVSICADAFTYLEPKELVLRSPKRQPARAIQAMKLERRFKRHGAAFRWLGSRTSLIFSGRTHSKWVVIDDIVYSFGGINMDNESFNNADYMFKFYDLNLADFIVKEHGHVRNVDRGGGGGRNHIYHINKYSTVLVDSGLPANSLIYRRARDLAKEAKEVTLVSQYCPTGSLNRIVRHKAEALYFNHWRHAPAINKILIRMGMITAKQHTAYTRDRYLHAKFIIYTMENGEKIAISGSHNFMFSSGLMGTREIALETSDPRIIKQLETFFKTYVLDK